MVVVRARSALPPFVFGWVADAAVCALQVQCYQAAYAGPPLPNVRSVCRRGTSGSLHPSTTGNSFMANVFRAMEAAGGSFDPVVELEAVQTAEAAAFAAYTSVTQYTLQTTTRVRPSVL